jgi:DNA-damage-inducible protein D
MSEIQDIDSSALSFEDFKNENGLIYWWASDLMVMLGYKEMKSFQAVLDRATKAFVSLGIPHYENIIAEMRDKNGIRIQDFKLSRFACYITVMNGNPKKVEVAQAQAYFAQQTRKFELFMPSWKLEKERGIMKGKLFDNMGRTELAANLFRVTQTEERIKNKKIAGQANLEQTHFQVGREVRGIIQNNMGINPESLPLDRQISDIKKELKDGHRKMLKDEKSTKKQSK